MNIVVNEDLKAYIDPLTPDEYGALERSILAEGCRDALVLWGDLLVDGHNRYAICQQHGLPFQTVQSKLFQTIEDVHLWMIDQHLGRRSVSDFQRGVLALRKREIVADRRSRWLATASEAHAAPAADGAEQGPPWDASAPASATQPASPAPAPLKSREDIAKAARLRSSQVVLIEKIQKQGAPELVAAVKSGAVSISTAATVATLPAEEQVAAVVGGKDDIKQAAKRVREAKRKPPTEPAVAVPATPLADGSPDAGADEALQAARQTIERLTAENDGLRQQVQALEAQLAQASAGAD
jgi:hypothetical protein